MEKGAKNWWAEEKILINDLKHSQKWLNQLSKICALLTENSEVILKVELKKEMNEQVNSDKHILKQQITSLKQVILKIQNDMEEVKKSSRCLSLRLPIKENEKNQGASEHVVGINITQHWKIKYRTNPEK